MAPRQEPLPPSPERRRSKIEDDLSAPPRQLRRGASPGFMRWILEELAGRDDTVKIESISTHDLTMGAEWNKALHKKEGYGYGPPTTQACIRALTVEAETSVYEFIAAASGLSWQNVGRDPPEGGVEFSSERLSDALQVQGTTNIGWTTNFTNDQWRAMVEDSKILVHGNSFVKSGGWYFLPGISWKHAAAQPLRDKLAEKFGDDWQKKCFGTSASSNPTLPLTLTLPLHRHRSPLTAHLSPFILTRYRDTFRIARVGVRVRWADRGDRRDRGD